MRRLDVDVILHSAGVSTLWDCLINKRLGSLRVQEGFSDKMERRIPLTFVVIAVSGHAGMTTIASHRPADNSLRALAITSAALGSDAKEQTQRPVLPPRARFPAYHPLETSQKPRPLQALVTRTETSIGRHLGTDARPNIVRIHRRLLRHHPQGSRWIVDQPQLVPGRTGIVDVTPGRSIRGARRGSQDVQGVDGDCAQVRRNGLR